MCRAIAGARGRRRGRLWAGRGSSVRPAHLRPRSYRSSEAKAAHRYVDVVAQGEERGGNQRPSRSEPGPLLSSPWPVWLES